MEVGVDDDGVVVPPHGPAERFLEVRLAGSPGHLLRGGHEGPEVNGCELSRGHQRQPTPHDPNRIARLCLGTRRDGEEAGQGETQGQSDVHASLPPGRQ